LPGSGVSTFDLAVRGIRTRIFEVDPGSELTPLILLHGGGLDSALVSFGSVLDSLGQRRRVIAPDLPGYGETDFPDSSFAIPWYADWVADLVGDLGLKRADLRGLSLGGWITLEVAISHPDVVRRIIAINPGGVTEKLKFIRTTRWLANHPGMKHRLDRWSVSMGRRLTRILLRAGVGVKNPAALSDALVDAVIANGKRPHAGKAFAATQRWAVDGGPVVWASQAIDGARMRLLEPCGHWLVLDCATEFVDAVNKFLDAA